MHHPKAPTQDVNMNGSCNRTLTVCRGDQNKVINLFQNFMAERAIPGRQHERRQEQMVQPVQPKRQCAGNLRVGYSRADSNRQHIAIHRKASAQLRGAGHLWSPKARSMRWAELLDCGYSLRCLWDVASGTAPSGW